MGIFNNLFRKKDYPTLSESELEKANKRAAEFGEKEAEMYVAGNFSPEYGMERANAGMSEIPTDATVAATKDDDIDFNHIVGGAHTNDLGEEEFNKAIK